MEIKSEAEIDKNVPSVSVAQAFAKNVLPVPGGFEYYLYKFNIIYKLYSLLPHIIIFLSMEF